MALTKKMLLCLAIFIAAITKPVSGVEISGKILAVPPASGSVAKGLQSLGPDSDATIKAVSPTGDTIAEAKSDKSGTYTLTIPANRKNDVTLIQTETSGAILRSLYKDGKTDINPVTEILAWKILDSGISLDDYTAEELQIIHDKLIAVSASIDFSDAANTSDVLSQLLDQPDFNITLGALTAIYGMQGDNRDQVESITSTVDSFLKGFADNNKDMIKKSLAPNASIFIAGELIQNTDKLLQKIDVIHSNFKNVSLESFFLSIEIKQNKAEVMTSEQIQMSSLESQDMSVNEAWIAHNTLELVNGNWIITAREIPKCHVGNATIVTDGHIDDWTNLKPCYYQKSDNKNPSGDSIMALFFARDNSFLYWRMDLDMKIQIPGSASPLQGIPRGTYSLYLMSKLSDVECDNFINFINNEISSVSSGGRTCITGTDGKPNEAYFLYDGFSIGQWSIEGKVPIEDFSFITDKIYAFVNANRKALPGLPANPDLLTGVVEMDFK